MFWEKKNKENGNGQNAGGLHETAAPININVVVKTDVGNIRTNNEDSASFYRNGNEQILREKGYLLIVADGMGGHQAGEVASKMAVEIISEEYFKPTKEINKEKILSAAFNTANKKIYEQASTNELHRGMGTTSTALVVLANTIYFAHSGDSRAYLYKNKTIIKLTEDHTYVQQLVNNGDISSEQADTHPQRNILTNAMGTKPTLRVDTGKCQVSFDENDRLLLCSDGLYDYLTDAELAQVMDTASLQDAADHFINEAKKRGGKDNITVVLAERIEERPAGVLKITRESELLKMTRDAELPTGINMTES
ncbi:MAG: Stp1/IreP family PP2C-type Ser/Thr phosphatase [Ferruginibacter sp.]